MSEEALSAVDGPAEDQPKRPAFTSEDIWDSMQDTKAQGARIGAIEAFLGELVLQMESKGHEELLQNVADAIAGWDDREESALALRLFDRTQIDPSGK